jgi:hypothetical protein
VKAAVKAMSLAVKLELRAVDFEPELEATIMYMTKVTIKVNILKLLEWSCHVGGFRGVPGSVRHGGVRLSRCFCLGKLSLSIGFGDVSLGT